MCIRDRLTSIYDNAGAAGGSGVFIADQNETWFVENLTGHTYLALKLSSSVVFKMCIRDRALAAARSFAVT